MTQNYEKENPGGAATMPRVFVDFNNADHRGRVRLNTRGTLRDLDKYGINLKDGLRIVLDDQDELSAVATICWDPREGWVAEIDWSNLSHRAASG